MKIYAENEFLVVEKYSNQDQVIEKYHKSNLKDFYNKVISVFKNEEKGYLDLLETRKKQDEALKINQDYRNKLLATIKEYFPEEAIEEVEVKTEATE